MICVVTGAAGFVGSHLCDALIRRGYRVIGIDDLCTGDLTNLAALSTNEAFRFEYGDVSDGVDVPERVDAVFHFASPASPKEYQRLSKETMRVNSLGTEHCAALAARDRARFVFASTSEVYGDPLVHPQPETYWGNVNSIGPRACYDEAKRFGEALAMEYARTCELDVRVVRIFNTYGPRMRAADGRVVPNFIEQALARRPLTIFGSGAQTRSLNYVDDTVETILRFFSLDDPMHRVVNVGSDEEVTVLDIAAIVCQAVGVELAVERHPAAPDDPQRRRPDLQRATAMLGRLPRTPLATGIARTVAWWRAKTALLEENQHCA
jgi:nucleoside-diphosphate-sugar epimerase